VEAVALRHEARESDRGGVVAAVGKQDQPDGVGGRDRHPHRGGRCLRDDEGRRESQGGPGVGEGPRRISRRGQDDAVAPVLAQVEESGQRLEVLECPRGVARPNLRRVPAERDRQVRHAQNAGQPLAAEHGGADRRRGRCCGGKPSREAKDVAAILSDEASLGVLRAWKSARAVRATRVERAKHRATCRADDANPRNVQPTAFGHGKSIVDTTTVRNGHRALGGVVIRPYSVDHGAGKASSGARVG